MSGREDPVGVFDSGTGGISTLRTLRQVLPNEHFIYYGDTANAPYGTKSPEEVMHCIRHVVDILKERNVKAIVIACNTATSVGASTLREELTIPVIGVEPALKPAALARKDGDILVLATPVTLALPKFQRLMAIYGEGAVPVPCAGLMELVEAEDWNGCKEYLQKILADFDLNRVDGIVLGCTHYVFLREMLEEMLPAHILVQDGNLGTAKQLKRVLEEKQLNRCAGEGSTELLTSGSKENIGVMRRLLERE